LGQNTDQEISLLRELEAEAIFILREAQELAAELKKPAVLLFSAGKDSALLLHLAAKAFAPRPIPFTALHIDTGFKFPEMYEFRDQTAKRYGVELYVHRNEQAIAAGTNPEALGRDRCCELLKTTALRQALEKLNCGVAIGGARRDEEASRAKERIFSLRNAAAQWEPEHQSIELGTLSGATLNGVNSMRVFPLSNWLEIDVWRYIDLESIEVPRLYFATKRDVIENGETVLVSRSANADASISTATVCRFRTLGCMQCSGAIRSTASSAEEVVRELQIRKDRERSHRLIDFDGPGALERKKRAGYF
jgi:sulfate adenylyltransferase subunit 2